MTRTSGAFPALAGRNIVVNDRKATSLQSVAQKAQNLKQNLKQNLVKLVKLVLDRSPSGGLKRETGCKFAAA
jgi:hypothetical protein